MEDIRKVIKKKQVILFKDIRFKWIYIRINYFTWSAHGNKNLKWLNQDRIGKSTHKSIISSIGHLSV